MILCLDVGNSHIFGGVFINDTLQFSFRYPSKEVSTSDVFGVFLRAVLRENQLEPTEVKQIALCSVVPSLDYSIRAACVKYFGVQPFELKAGVKTGLKIQFKNPLEVGADRIANAIAVTDLFPQQNIIVIDFGTATTFCAIAANKAYVGGVILPGLRISVEALNSNAAKLSPVPILKPAQAVGRTTAENIQSGLYYGQLGTIKELTTRIADEVFAGEKPLVIGTGGFAQLFEAEGIFSQVVPDLVLHGLRVALQQNVI